MDHGVELIIAQLTVGKLELCADNWAMMFNVRN